MTKTALPRTLATALCKTRNWLLVEQAGNDIYWCGTEDNMLHTGEQKELTDMLEIIQSENHSWMLQAFTEPAVGEDEIGLALDLLFPLDVRAALGDKRTAKAILREIYRYVDKALSLVGTHKPLRGFSEETFGVEPSAPMEETMLVNKYALFLCDDQVEPLKLVASGDRIHVQSNTADNLWYNQAVKNLFPACAYFQKFCGVGDTMWFYNMASIENTTGAAVEFELELAALDDYLRSSSYHSDHGLFHVCSTDEARYTDLLLEAPDYQSASVRSLTSLGEKLCALCNRPKSTRIRDVDITKNATSAKKELLNRHLSDAVAPFVRLGWEGAEWLH